MERPTTSQYQKRAPSVTENRTPNRVPNGQTAWEDAPDHSGAEMSLPTQQVARRRNSLAETCGDTESDRRKRAESRIIISPLTESITASGVTTATAARKTSRHRQAIQALIIPRTAMRSPAWVTDPHHATIPTAWGVTPHDAAYLAGDHVRAGQRSPRFLARCGPLKTVTGDPIADDPPTPLWTETS